MIGRRLAKALRVSGQATARHYRRIAVRVVPIRTWYRGPGMVRGRARPSPPAVRDVGAIPGARSHPLVLALRRYATRRGQPGASVTDRGTVTVRLMTVRAAGIPAPITNRVTTDHRPAGPASVTADIIERYSPLRPIASTRGDRFFIARPPDGICSTSPSRRSRPTLLSRRRAPGPSARSHQSGAPAG
jgi:hypothetical protein